MVGKLFTILMHLSCIVGLIFIAYVNLFIKKTKIDKLNNDLSLYRAKIDYYEDKCKENSIPLFGESNNNNVH